MRMMPINKSLTLEKIRGIANKEDEVNEGALLAQILRKLQLSDLKFNKMLSHISRGQETIIDSLASDEMTEA